MAVSGLVCRMNGNHTDRSSEGFRSSACGILRQVRKPSYQIFLSRLGLSGDSVAGERWQKSFFLGLFSWLSFSATSDCYHQPVRVELRGLADSIHCSLERMQHYLPLDSASPECAALT